MSEPNEPAFPVVWKNPLTGEEGTCVGMTTRQAFVMAAMQGMMGEFMETFSTDLHCGGTSATDYLTHRIMHSVDACLAEEARTRKEG